MTVRELYLQLGTLVAVHGDCDVVVMVDGEPETVLRVQPDVTPFEGDGFPMTVLHVQG